MNHRYSDSPENAIPAESPKGFIAFCETNLRYEKGFKAWIFLGPYLLGAFVLESWVTTYRDSLAEFALGGVFLAYLIFFPETWRRLLKWRDSRKALLKTSGDTGAE
jgi:hypothetical protein